MSETATPYGWDDPLPANSAEFKLLPPGDYQFVVVAFARGRHTGSPKLPPCPRADVTVRIDGGDNGTLELTEKLHISEVCIGIVTAFWLSVGVQPVNGQVIPDWGNVVGMSGTVRVKHRQHNDRTYHDLQWLAPDAAKPPKPDKPSFEF